MPSGISLTEPFFSEEAGLTRPTQALLPLVVWSLIMQSIAMPIIAHKPKAEVSIILIADHTAQRAAVMRAMFARRLCAQIAVAVAWVQICFIAVKG